MLADKPRFECTEGSSGGGREMVVVVRGENGEAVVAARGGSE